MHEEIKTVLGIEIANCSTCGCLGSDGDGYEYGGNWSTCNKYDKFVYLKSFPFKKEMSCWEPDFWHSKFSDMIKTVEDEEIADLNKCFSNTVGQLRQTKE